MLEGALSMFYEVGYHGSSVREIARRIGLTVPALYYHYENKEAMLAALLDRAVEFVREQTAKAVADGGDDPSQQFENLVACLVLHMTQNQQIASMDAEIRALGPENRAAYAAKRRSVELLALEVVERGVANGDFSVSHPARTTRALLGMIQAITLWYHPDGGLSPSQIAADYVDIALRLVGSRHLGA